MTLQLAAAESLARRIDQFLASRGYIPPSADGGSVAAASPISGTAPPAAAAALRQPDRGEKALSTGAGEKAADFVCEDDVRQAIRQGRKITIGERSIVTPSARDLGEQHRLFVHASWPR